MKKVIVLNMDQVRAIDPKGVLSLGAKIQDAAQLLEIPPSEILRLVIAELSLSLRASGGPLPPEPAAE